MNTFDTVVIGLGAWGSAALYHLARRGQKVCGVEQFSIGHDRGSAHGNARMIRLGYFLHPDYIPALRRAYELWAELETAGREPLMKLPGVLCFGPPDGPLVQGLARCYAAHALPHETFGAEEAKRRFPQFQLPANAQCYFDPQGGYLYPEACVRAHIEGAQLASATIVQGEAVLAWEHEANGVTLRTANRSLRAARVILAAGAFSNALLTGAPDRPIQPRRKVTFWYGMAQPQEFMPENFPSWIGEEQGREFYGFPTLDRHGLQAAEHAGGQLLHDPNRVARDLQPEDEPRLRAFLERTFGSRVLERQRHKTCLYEETVDQHFIVDHHPQWPNIIVAAGGSGHGFKFSPVVGEMAAQLAIDGHAPLRPELFAVRGRF